MSRTSDRGSRKRTTDQMSNTGVDSYEQMYCCDEKEEDAISCSKCKKWFHLSCAQIPPYLYYSLMQPASPWYCQICVETSPESLEDVSSGSQTVETASMSRIDRLLNAITGISKKIENTSVELNNKLDHTSTELNNKLDRTSTELNDKLDRTSTELNSKLDRVEKESQDFRSSIESSVSKLTTELSAMKLTVDVLTKRTDELAVSVEHSDSRLNSTIDV